jgi:hypothetical protein
MKQATYALSRTPQVMLVLAALGACARVASSPEAARDGGASSQSSQSSQLGDAATESAAEKRPTPAAMAGADSLDAGLGPHQLDPDGNDDEEDPGTGAAPSAGLWEKVGTPPLALTRVCDLTPFQGALYAAHANQPLGTDGATITRYRPDDGRFTVAFDWNRPGEPTKGGGAGQGFVRVHAIGGRLFVADADPPYGGLQLVDWGTEGYVFVSDDKGVFAPPRSPHFRPPGPPELRLSADAGPRAGAGVLPRAYHVLDVIRFRGAFYASTGSVPPKERAWNGPSPGALHRASEDGARWTYEVDYPYPWQDGVWRLTYMVRFKDRLYAGIQDYDGRDPNDYVYFSPPVVDAGPTVLRHEDAHPTRVTRLGASGTLRWWVDSHVHPARLYWLAWTRDGVVLRVTTDGDRWAAIALPPDAGRPTDVTRFRDAVVVLTERGLYRLSGSPIDGSSELDASEGVADARVTLIAPVDDLPDGGAPKKRPKSPFELTDFFCSAPLAVLNGVLYAGGQRGGSIYRLREGG